MNPIHGATVRLTDFPLLVFVTSLVLLMFSLWTGARLLRRWFVPSDNMREDFGIVLGASLTLLALLVGFSFSMAVSRYDQRKSLEEAEANAIGTEYLRADLLPDADAAKVRALLHAYFEQRILFYTVRPDRLREIDARTTALQTEMWAAVAAPAKAAPTPTAALVAMGMNDVLNSQGYTQAAWWNRIPPAAWLLMTVIAVISPVRKNACCTSGLEKVSTTFDQPGFSAVYTMPARGSSSRTPTYRMLRPTIRLRTRRRRPLPGRETGGWEGVLMRRPPSASGGERSPARARTRC